MADTTSSINAVAGRLHQAAHSAGELDLMLAGLDQVLATAGPRQAEILRRCAIPRWFDTGVLRVLREQESGNEQVFALLRGYSFVCDHGEGRLAYQDAVRRALLAQWQSERPDELRLIHRRLFSYFSTRTTPLGTAAPAMPFLPDSTTLSVVRQSAEADLLRREALYHMLHLDKDRGLEELRRAFASHLTTHRLAEAELLVQIAGETPLGPRERRWVQFLRARALQAGLRLDEALRQIEALQARGDLEPDLAAAIDRTLGEIASESDQYARATSFFRQSSAYFARTNNLAEVAPTILRLGDAYRHLAQSTGSWHVPEPYPHPLLQTAYAAWIWLLGLPFQVAIMLMGRNYRFLPQPRFCAYFQNWLLIRLYNTARASYVDAREAYSRLGDPLGVLLAEHRLAELLLIYGYHADAQVAIEALLQCPAARDPYYRAWLQHSLAECMLAAGDVAGARRLIDETTAFFAHLGDTRREAALRALQGRAAIQAGDFEAALQGYAYALEHCHPAGCAPARERILHELRIWQHHPGLADEPRARLVALIAAAPEKRYGGRFIRSYQRRLQITTMLALPLALLLMSAMAPTAMLRPSEAGVAFLGFFFYPWRLIGVGATLILIYLTIYAAIATAVIYWLPLPRIEREQPQLLVTTPETVARYDAYGRLELQLAWTTITRWVTLDRCLWRRPLTLYSQTYLEDAAGRGLVIDGFTGWYEELQSDVGARLAAAGSPAVREDLGYSVVRSLAGVSAGVGVLLLILAAASNNLWLDLGGRFPPGLTAAIWLVAFSGALLLAPIACWLAIRPLKLEGSMLLKERWPRVLLVLGGLAVASYVLGRGTLIPVAALNYGIFVWGVYILAEAVATIVAPGRRLARLSLVAGACLLALAIVWTPALAHYHWLQSYIARNQADQGVTSAVASCDAAARARALGSPPAPTWLIEGDCAAIADDWPRATSQYEAAVAAALPDSGEQAVAYFNLAVAAGRVGDARRQQEALQAYQAICSGEPPEPALCDQLVPDPTPTPSAPEPGLPSP